MIKIDVRPLKAKVSMLPQSVANLILQEADFMDANEFFAKADVWYKALMQVSVEGLK